MCDVFVFFFLEDEKWMRGFAFPFRVQTGLASSPFRVRRFAIAFHRSFVRRFLIRRMAVKTPLCRWACRVRTVRAKPDFQTRRRAISRQLSRSLTGSTLPRASPSLRDPYATGSGRAAVRQSSSSRIARAESSRRFRSGSVRLFVCHAKAFFPRRTSRAMLPSMVRRYAAARRKQTRSQRLRARYARTDGPPVSLARSRSRSASRSRGDPRAPRRFDPPAFANDAFGAFDKFRILTPPPTGRNCSSSPPL